MGSIRYSPEQNEQTFEGQCSFHVLPVFTYGAETLTLIKVSENRLSSEKRHPMLRILLRDKVTNQWIRQQTDKLKKMKLLLALLSFN